MDSARDQTVRSERADLPHHRRCHSCESLQPSWAGRGCGRAGNRQQKKKENVIISPYISTLDSDALTKPIYSWFLLGYCSEEDGVHW